MVLLYIFTDINIKRPESVEDVNILIKRLSTVVPFYRAIATPLDLHLNQIGGYVRSADELTKSFGVCEND